MNDLPHISPLDQARILSEALPQMQDATLRQRHGREHGECVEQQHRRRRCQP